MTRIRRRCGVRLLAAAILLAAAAVGAQRLGLDAPTETLAPAASPSGAATAASAHAFGGDPVVVLVRGPWRVATATSNIVVLATLEGRLMHVPGVKLVEGPGGLVDTAANAALDVALGRVRAAGRAAGDAARAAALRAGRSAADADTAARAAEVDSFRRETVVLLQTFPQIRETGLPGLDNPRFVDAVLFRADGSVTPLVRQLFPRPGATLVVVRLADGAGLATVRRVRETVSEMLGRYPLTGVSAVVSGAPVVEEGLTRAAATDLRAVLPAAGVAMLAILLLLLDGVGAARGTRHRLRLATAGLAALGVRRRAAVVAVAGLVGVTGLALTPLERTTTDIRDLASAGLPALRDLGTLERATGAGGEIDVLVDAPDVATPAVVAWMLGAEARLRRLLPAGAPPPVSLADLLVAVNRGTPPDVRATNQILQTVPAYLLQPLVTPDAAHASMTLGIPLQDLRRQERLVGRMRAALRPPPGVTARLAGAAVLAADGESGLAVSGLLVDLLALAAVALVLLAVTRSGRRVVVALVPVVLTTGWTTLAVVALRIQVTPITAVLGALVVALATEFSVIWSTRFREARREGLGAEEAAAVTAARTGSAIAVSGLTLCAGFLALAAGSSPLLRSFGLVAGCGVVAAVAAVLLLCPPLCARLIHVEPATAPASEPQAHPPAAWSPLASPATDSDG
jgi:MMPL family